MQQKGFLASLFDLSFSSMITVRIIQILYVLSLLGAALYTIVIIAIAFSASDAAGVVVLILSPLIFIVFAIFARVYLEVLVVVFKIADNTAAIADNTKRQVMPGGDRPSAGQP